MASGPSAKSQKLDILRGRSRVVAIKQNVDLCPWADLVYGCDPAWWKFRKGLPEYAGLKVAWEGANLDFPDIRTVEIAKAPKGGGYSNTLQFDRTGLIGGGGNSGFQALNLAVQLGATTIVLVGFDMTDRGGVHWYGRNHWERANNPTTDNFGRWIASLRSASHALKARGVRVINASPQSALDCFEKTRGLDEALDLDRLRSA